MAPLAILIGILAADPAAGGSELLRRAEAAFQEGLGLREQPDEARRAFRQAAEAYEQLRRQGIRNVDLFRNQGDAHLLAGELPQAILAYRRGERLAPCDRELWACLAYARKQAGTTEGGQAIRRLLAGYGDLILAALAACYVLACLSLTNWWLNARRWTLVLGTVTAGLSLPLALALALVAFENRRERLYPLAVIETDRVVLRTGNGVNYPTRPGKPPARGTEARCLFRRGEWLQIELPGGEVGWVPAGSALVDEP